MLARISLSMQASIKLDSLCNNLHTKLENYIDFSDEYLQPKIGLGNIDPPRWDIDVKLMGDDHRQNIFGILDAIFM